MSDETKITKFEVILREVQEWLESPLAETSRIGASPTSILVASSMSMLSAADKMRSMVQNNDYKNFSFRSGNVVWQPSFLDGYNSNPYSVMARKIAGFGVARAEINTISDVISIIKAYKGNSWQGARNCMIFWMLFLAALDDEIYNNELDSIIDIAYCMDFDEPMIRDWCHAVEYVMQGNRLQEGCDFPCETQQGARFFLHKDSSDSKVSEL